MTPREPTYSRPGLSDIVAWTIWGIFWAILLSPFVFMLVFRR